MLLCKNPILNKVKSKKQASPFSALSKKELASFIDLLLGSYSLARHDLKNSLTSLIGFSIILSNRLAFNPTDKSEAKIVELISRIESSANNILNKLETYFLIHEANQRFSQRESMLLAPFNLIVEKLKINFPKKQIVFSRESPRKLVIYFPGNILLGILIELITNSIKHNKVEAQIRISWRIKNNCFYLTYRDNGKMRAMKIGDRYSPFLQIERIERKGKIGQKGGLILINNLLYLVGGYMLMRRSSQLEGIDIQIVLPNIKYYYK